MIKVFTNPGHCPGVDSGATGFGIKECDYALEVTTLMNQMLTDAGFAVKTMQSNDLYAVCDTANAWGADIFVSVHCNAFNESARGTETLHYPGSFKSQALAQKIQDRMIAAIGTVNRGLKERPGLVVLNSTAMPAALVETAFIDEQNDNQILVNNKEKIARAIVNGVIDFANQNLNANVNALTDTPEVFVEQIEEPAPITNNGVRVITPEDIAYFVSKVLIESGVEGAFDSITKSSKSDYPSIGCSQWLYERADNILSKIPGGAKFVGKTYSSIVNEDLMDELKSVLGTPEAQKVQLEQLAADCLSYVNDLRQIWYLDDTRCLIYAATWATTSVSTVHKFIERERGYSNIRSLLALANAFSTSYRDFFGVDEKYQLGYSNRAWRVFYAVAELDLTTDFAVPWYGKGPFGR